MGNHAILSKVDRAVAAYLIDCEVGTADNVFPAWGLFTADKEAPCVVVHSSQASETAPYAGTYTVNVAVMVRLDPANMTRTEADALTSAVFDALHTNVTISGDKLAEDIQTAGRALATSAPDTDADMAALTLLNVAFSSIESGTEQEVWVYTLNLQIVAAPTAAIDPDPVTP